MTPPSSPFGRPLKSLAVQLTRWMKPKVKKSDVTDGTEGADVPDTKPVESVKPKPKAIRSRPLPKPVMVAEPEPAVEPEIEVEEEPETKASSPVSDLLSSFPENKNLVGQTEVIFTLGGKKHALMVRTDCIYLDAQKYLVSANGGALGGDVELDILDFKRAGDTVTMKVGAFGKDVSIAMNTDETAAMFELMLKGKTSKHTADRGQVIEITRNNY